jgi:hypothetical protein
MDFLFLGLGGSAWPLGSPLQRQIEKIYTNPNSFNGAARGDATVIFTHAWVLKEMSFVLVVLGGSPCNITGGSPPLSKWVAVQFYEAVLYYVAL